MAISGSTAVVISGVAGLLLGALAAIVVPRPPDRELTNQAKALYLRATQCESHLQSERDDRKAKEADAERKINEKYALFPEYVDLIALIAKKTATPEDKFNLQSEINVSLISKTREIEGLIKYRILDARGMVTNPLKAIRLLVKRLRGEYGKGTARNILMNSFGPSMGALFDSIPERAESAGLPPI